MNTNDPENYKKMSEPFASRQEAALATERFYDAVMEARNKYRMRDVHLIVQVRYTERKKAGLGLSDAHFGDSSESERMCAWALGRLSSLREQFQEALRKFSESQAEPKS